MIINNDSLVALKELADNSIDAVITDPPYGYSFMSKDWDKAVPSVDIWRECLRVLKPGGWCMVMSAPRSDVQAQMIVRLTEAGFRLDFTPIYWTYASGFPKAGNVGKLVDKRNGRDQDAYKPFAEYLKACRLAAGYTMKYMDGWLGTNTAYSWWEGRASGIQLPRKPYYLQLKLLLGMDDRFDELIERNEAEREVVGKYKGDMGGLGGTRLGEKGGDITTAALDAAKALDGSYTGFQPKPAVEVIIVAMKPLSEKTYVDQALKNGKGITWLDDCRIPTQGAADEASMKVGHVGKPKFDGTKYADDDYSLGMKSTQEIHQAGRFPANVLVSDQALNGHSKYFDLDAWADTLPFLAVPKASKSEKNAGLSNFQDKNAMRVNAPRANEEAKHATLTKNVHPTVKPLKLMSYLITLTTREGDTVLDPFVGSGTTAVAAKQLGRVGIGIEREPEYAEIAKARYDYAEMKKEPEQTTLI